MIEVLKQMVEALQTRICSCCYESEICCAPAIKNAIQAGRKAITELESQESQIKTTDPFESAKVEDYNRGWNDCLFASGIVKQSQRTWVGLTDEEVNNAIKEKNITPLFTYRMIAKAIEAKLKEKNS